jgi:hypothetical protein
MTDRLARGSLAGRLEQRADASPGLRGSLTIEQNVDLKADSHVWLTAWVRVDPSSGARWLSIVAEPATKEGHKR